MRTHPHPHSHSHSKSHGPAAEAGGRDHPHRRGAGRHDHGERRSRPFGNGDLKLILLALIGQADSHGYELIKSIEDKLGGGYSPSPGIVYPTLTLLEELGFLSSVADGAKKLYALTASGRAELEANADALGRLDAGMAAFGAASGEGRTGPIARAMENLKLALRMRTARGALTDAQIAAIRTVLDAGATAIEQV